MERIDEDNPKEERLFRDLWEDKTQRDVVLDCLKADLRPPLPWYFFELLRAVLGRAASVCGTNL